MARIIVRPGPYEHGGGIAKCVLSGNGENSDVQQLPFVASREQGERRRHGSVRYSRNERSSEIRLETKGARKVCVRICGKNNEIERTTPRGRH